VLPPRAERHPLRRGAIFRTDPKSFISGAEKDRAVRSLACYFKSFTGSHFERFMDHDRPNEFTANDFLAVSMLGVNIPASAAIWLRNEGRAEVKTLLAEIGPADRHIWDPGADLSATSAATRLWRLARRHRWPEGEAASGLGRTKASKLLAAKRPNLLPVYDKHVAAALLTDPADNDWVLWHQRFQGAGSQEIRRAIDDLRTEVQIPSDVAVLRVLDVAIWMRVHGYRYSNELSDFNNAPRFWIKETTEQ